MTDYSKHWTQARQLGLDQPTATVASHVSGVIYDAEVQRIFRRLWLMIGRVEDVPEPGNFMLREIPTLNAELLIVRGKDGVVRAFYNTCAHRGVPVVHQRRGSALTFRCPYHSWLYGADGSLRSIPAQEQFPCVNKADNGLVGVTLDVWNGFLFVNFAPEPMQTLDEFLGGLGQLHGSLPFERYAFHIDTVYDVAGNWKAGMHTFSEGYHITTAHSRTLTPQIVTAANPTFNFYDINLFGPHSTLTSERNFDWRPKSPVVTFAIGQMRPAVMPRGDDVSHDSAAPDDGACKNEVDFATHPAINRIGLPNFGVETITIYPNICLQPLGGGYLWMTFWPMAPDRMRVEVRSHSLTAPTTLRGEFATAYAAAAARDVLSEDFALTAQQQRGLAMGARKHQNFGENEALLRFIARVTDHYLASDDPFVGDTVPGLE